MGRQNVPETGEENLPHWDEVTCPASSGHILSPPPLSNFKKNINNMYFKRRIRAQFEALVSVAEAVKYRQSDSEPEKDRGFKSLHILQLWILL
jgi:hypothetical protein